jgi:site-specific recombinase XerD
VARQKKKATADRPAIEAFALFLNQAGLSKRTVSFYLRDIERFFDWLRTRQKRAWRWQDVTELALEEFRASLTKEDKLSLSTVNRALHALRKFCCWATEKGLLEEDPCSNYCHSSSTREERSSPSVCH